MARDSEQGKQHFIRGEDRPEVKLDPDKPIGELRVRDLQDILGSLPELKALREKALKQEKLEKFEGIEKLKLEKPEKFEKLEKLEKPEKIEKLEFEPPVKRVPDWLKAGREPNEVIDPEILPQILQHIQGLTQRLDKYGDQLADLQKRIK